MFYGHLHNLQKLKATALTDELSLSISEVLNVCCCSVVSLQGDCFHFNKIVQYEEITTACFYLNISL